ncbi:hypothetical protein D9M68_148820 [compost metagenome]
MTFRRILSALCRLRREAVSGLLANVLRIEMGLRSRFSHTSTVTDDADVIVSLTTYNKRFDYVHLTIESLLCQDASCAYELHLYIAAEDLKECGGTIPHNISRLRARGLKIFVLTENVKSYKKLVYAVGDSPAKTIITADDDVFYPKFFVRKLMDKAMEHAGCVVCFRGHFFSFEEDGSLAPYRNIIDRGSDDFMRTTPSLRLLPTGVSGVLYPPGSLDIMATDSEQYLSLAPSADDVWFKISTLAKRTRCVQVEPRNIHFLSVPNSQKFSLFNSNVSESKNDEQIRKCFDRYPLLLSMIRAEYEQMPKKGAGVVLS